MLRRTAAACFAMGGFFISAQAADRTDRNGGVEAGIVVTVADHGNHEPQALKREDIISAGFYRVIDITPLHGDAELFVVIDDAATYDFGTKLQELRRFLNAQPTSTAIGVAFIKNGELDIVQTPSKDHGLAARALRAPLGSKPSNPYCALSSLILGWSGNAPQREVLMITSGIDYSYTPGQGAICSNAETAIVDAQRAGVLVYAIYHPDADYDKQEWQRVDDGVVQLAHVCFETGGESYFISHGPAETIAPYLDDISEHLANQYLMTVVIDSPSESGFQQLYLDSKTAGMQLMAPARIWVGTKPAPGRQEGRGH